MYNGEMYYTVLHILLDLPPWHGVDPELHVQQGGVLYCTTYTVGSVICHGDHLELHVQRGGVLYSTIL